MHFMSSNVLLLFYIIGILLAVCTALPIQITPIDDASHIIAGLVAFISISLVAVACVCCRRGKRGFEEFENETSLPEQPAHSEYPIFRAISPHSITNNTQDGVNGLENVNGALPNAANTNYNNLSGEDTSRSQGNNNSRPINTVPLENIENINGTSQFRNCNEVTIVIDQSPVHSVNRNSNANTPSSESVPNKFSEQTGINYNASIATASLNDGNFSSNIIIVPQQTTNPFNYEQRDSDYAINIDNIVRVDQHKDTDSHRKTDTENLHGRNNSKNPFNNDQTVTIDSLSLENEKFSSPIEEQQFQKKSVNNLENITPSLRKSSIASDKVDSDDANSVEEALRALDFAISGEESLLPDSDEEDNDHNDDDDDGVEDEPVASNIYSGADTKAENLSGDKYNDICTNNLNIDTNNTTNINDNDNDNDNDNSNENETSLQNVLNEFLINSVANNFVDADGNSEKQSEEKIDDVENERYAAVYEEAKLLVDGVLEECQNVVHSRQVNNITDNNNDCNKCINKPKSRIENNCELTQDRFNCENLTSNVTCDNETETPNVIQLDRDQNQNNETVRIVTENVEQTKNEPIEQSNLDDSIENIFCGKLEASTPCVKSKVILNEGSKPITANLFANTSIDDSLNDISPLSPTRKHFQNDGTFTCDIENSHLKKSGETFLANDEKFTEDPSCLFNGTYDVSPIKTDKNNENVTFIKSSEDSMLSKAKNVSAETNGTFCIQLSEIKPNTTIVLSCSSSTRPLKENPTIKIDKDETTSDDLTTATPMNTPIELNYAGDSWDNFISKSMNQVENQTQSLGTETNTLCQPSTSGAMAGTSWFLHPQQIDETYDMGEPCDSDSEEDEDNDNNAALLSSTFDALRKQLAEVLPHASGNVTAPLDFSDNENDSDDDNDDVDQIIERCSDMQSEMIINYKRQLSPIMEESEDETCKTFIMNETKCLDSTSTGCMETGEAIMGVTKTLMASNDTLFNFEDTLGDRDDMFSPRTPHSGVNTCTATTPQPVECITPTNDSICPEFNLPTAINTTAVRPTLKPFDFETVFDADELPSTVLNDLLSPEQVKTFSEEINSIEQSSDLSGTIDATTNTLDDLKTCISVHLRNDDDDNNDEEMSDWAESSVSLLQPESVIVEHNKNLTNNTNPADDQNIEDMEKASSSNSQHSPPVENAQEIHALNNDGTINSNQLMHPSSPSISTTYSASLSPTSSSSSSPSISDKSPSEKETDNDRCNENSKTVHSTHHNGNDDKYNGDLSYKENTMNFLTKEIEYASSQNSLTKSSSEPSEYYKENKDPNAKQVKVGKKCMSAISDGKESSATKIQNNSQATVIYADVLNEPEITQRIAEPHFTRSDIEMPKHLPVHSNYTTICEINTENESNCVVVVDDMISQLSGEEDPWAHPISDIRFNGPCTEIISTTFDGNEWDSDVEDSNSSEEFMYVKGTPQIENVSHSKDVVNDVHRNEEMKAESDRYGNEIHISDTKENNGNELFDDQPDIDNIWNSHEDKIPVSSKASNDKALPDESSDDSNSSDVEDEWVPSSWDSLAQPSRSALKSPDKSSSEEDTTGNNTNKARRSVAFKKQNYHSVYEYPKETIALSPAYSEPQMWRNFLPNSPFSSMIDSDESNVDFDDLEGFNISSSTRPFHGSQFNAQCHTWPTDSDFSWSQIQNNDDSIDKYPSYSPMSADWSNDIGQMYSGISEENKDTGDEDVQRPDSGVGESAELLTESISMGDLCHTKSSLRLPLNIFPAAVVPTNSDKSCPNSIVSVESEDRLPSTDSMLMQSSCTGSIDSLSSSSTSSAERQLSFTTFGKKSLNQSTVETASEATTLSKDSDINAEQESQQRHRIENTDPATDQTENLNYQSDMRTATIDLIENETNLINKQDDSNTLIVNGNANNTEGNDVDKIILNYGTNKLSCNVNERNESTRQNDSTDEDSGIESVMRMGKENV